MASLAVTLSLAVVVFFSTNIDDLFMLLAFFGEQRARFREIVAGQYAGVLAIYGLSIACALTSLVLPRPYVGLLGLAPIGIGALKLRGLRRAQASPKAWRPLSSSGTASRTLAVAVATLANGGDDIGIYAPLFSGRPPRQIAVFGAVILSMTAVLCLAGRWLVAHPVMGAPIRRYGAVAAPFLLITLGVLVLWRAGSFGLFR